MMYDIDCLTIYGVVFLTLVSEARNHFWKRTKLKKMKFELENKYSEIREERNSLRLMLGMKISKGGSYDNE